jgi:hypothetical protein
MKKEIKVRAKLTLRRESIQMLEGGLQRARGAYLPSGEDCSIGSGCVSCHIPHCTTTA